MSFNGRYLIKIQSKSQVVLPAKLKDDENSSEMPKTFYLMHESFVGSSEISPKENLGRIFMYPTAVWNELVLQMEARLRAAGAKDIGQQIRLLRASVERVELDTQNRFTLRKELLDRALISDKEVYFIGNGFRIEIWDKSSYDTFSSRYEHSIRDIFKQLSEDL